LFFAHNVIIWVIMVPILQIPVTFSLLLVIPALALLVTNGVWVTLFFGIIATRFRDVAPLLDALTQLLFYVTPIVWTTHTLVERGGEIAQQAKIVEINPLFHYLEIVRAPMLGQPLEAYHWWIVIGCTVAGLLGTTVLMRQWRARVSYWV
jgi:ABC-2 type transport system permease protein